MVSAIAAEHIIRGFVVAPEGTDRIVDLSSVLEGAGWARFLGMRIHRLRKHERIGR